jgi:hypothetical protein
MGRGAGPSLRRENVVGNWQLAIGNWQLAIDN